MIDLIRTLARHPIGGNVLMILIFLLGWYATTQLNTQFFPTFAFDVVFVRVEWRGATAEDVEEAITNPLERELKTTPGMRNFTSTSSFGVSAISLEFEKGTDLVLALDEVRRRVSLVRNLPADAETPQVTPVVRYEPIARVLVSGADADELRRLALQFERELLQRGVARVDFSGMPEEEVAIDFTPSALRALDVSLATVASQIANTSRDLPAGSVGEQEGAKQLRALEQRRNEAQFADLPLQLDGAVVRLGDVATVERRPRDNEPHVEQDGRPAIEMIVERTETSDSLEGAAILRRWIDDTRPQLPRGVTLTVYGDTAQLLDERLWLLIKNGVSGLVLVVVALYLLLNARVAFWVAMGVPTAIAGSLVVLWLIGGSINMISLLAFIIATGIIVDDAIVVGEDTLARHEQGEDPVSAAENAAVDMLNPIAASMLTTVAAFLPLLIIGGVIGNILRDIPIVVICALIASLVECFLVLPAHLRDALHAQAKSQPGKLRQWLERQFLRLQNHIVRPWIIWSLNYRVVVFAVTFALMSSSIGLLAGGRVGFNFFPTPDGNNLYASFSFVAGTPTAATRAFMGTLVTALHETARDFDEEGLVVVAVERYGQAQQGQRIVSTGDQHGTVFVELKSAETRSVLMNDFVKAWAAKVTPPPGIENWGVSALQAGPPGRDLDIRLLGDDPAVLKAAAVELATAMTSIGGVSAVLDDLPYGREQWIYRLTPTAERVGLSISSVGSQLRTALDGLQVQIFQQRGEEIEVRVGLTRAVRRQFDELMQLPITLPNGDVMPFSQVATLSARQSFDVLRHGEGRLAVQVSGDVDSRQISAGEALQRLQTDTLPALMARYGLEYDLQGRGADRAETLGDMRRGLVLGLALMYLALALASGSFVWPLVIITIIPIGFAGALIGHWAMGMDLTILSLFGIFGLAGIGVNDSIVLVDFYRRQREQGRGVRESLIEASCLRLRAVLLTSTTTIAGLLPLIFEQSLQAQFLIPIAVSLCFGLAFTTFWVLIWIPVLLSFERDQPVVAPQPAALTA